mgnify:CR=1 FL=1
MNEREEQQVRNHLRQVRATLCSIVNQDWQKTSTIPHAALAGIAHIDQAGDVLDDMRRREESTRIAWTRRMQSEAEELF